jgi:four helix bundle protein
MEPSSFRGLRVWHSARQFKLAIYRLSDEGPLSHQPRIREQLREAAASAPSQIAEGYGRFDPPDNARFVRIAKASLLECQNHLLDAADRGLISEETRKLHDAQAEDLLKEVEAYLGYLQSNEARMNADRIRRARRTRTKRTASGNPEP